jgi:hypothetical protein
MQPELSDMAQVRMIVGLIVECRKTVGPWSDYAWAPVQVFATPPETPSWTRLASSPHAVQYYAGEAEIELHSSDTDQYGANLATGAPKLWVALRAEGPEPPIDVVAVTANPSEGEGLTEAGTNIVETLPMPAEIAAHLAAFFAEHHVERPFYKRQRDRSERDPTRGRGGPREHQD